MFLAKGRENEIGVRHGKELQLGLRTAGDAASPHAPVTDGDFGLNYLVALSSWIFSGIDKRSQSRLLIILQEEPANRHDQSEGQRDYRDVLPSESGQTNSGSQNWNISQRRSKIRLLHYQQHRNS